MRKPVLLAVIVAAVVAASCRKVEFSSRNAVVKAKNTLNAKEYSGWD